VAELSRLLEVRDLLDDVRTRVSDLPFSKYLSNHITSATIEINRQIRLCEHHAKK